MGKEVFVDANIFLEVFFDDSKADECEKFLESFNINEDIMFTSDFLIYSCLIAIENKFKDNKKLEKALIFFSSLSNLRILIPSFDELYDAIEIMKSEKLDFDDSLVIACMKNYGIKKLVSLDKHFDKIKGIERVKL